jgi:hypothetical protein
VLSVKSPQFSNCPYAKCHFLGPSLTGLVLPSQPSLPLSTTTNPILVCRGKGTKRTFRHPFTISLLMRGSFPSKPSYGSSVTRLTKGETCLNRQVLAQTKGVFPRPMNMKQKSHLKSLVKVKLLQPKSSFSQYPVWANCFLAIRFQSQWIWSDDGGTWTCQISRPPGKC